MICESSHIHCVKIARIRSYSGPHFSRIFLAFSRIGTEYGEVPSISPYLVQMQKNVRKMRTRITPSTDKFYTVVAGKIMMDFKEKKFF